MPSKSIRFCVYQCWLEAKLTLHIGSSSKHRNFSVFGVANRVANRVSIKYKNMFPGSQIAKSCKKKADKVK